MNEGKIKMQSKKEEEEDAKPKTNMIASSNSAGSSGASGSNSSCNGIPHEKDKIWYFNAEQLANSPSRRHGIDPDQELFFRQMTAYLIQEMGQRLQVSQLCINTAIVYMHRFYAFHSFMHFHRNSIAAASLFLAAKVEEQPRKLEHVIKAANKCLTSPNEASYSEQAQELVFNENVLLQTLGFDVAIDHPHTHVVKTCHLVKAGKDLAQTSYFLASNSLHLTSMCLQYRPTVVACFCIYLACKWSRWEIPQSTEGKYWFHYVDKSVTLDLLKKLTEEFIGIYEKSPARLKNKLNSIKAIAQGAGNRGVKQDKKEEWKMGDMMKGYHSSINTNDSNSNGGYSSSSNDSTQVSGSSSSAALLPPPLQPPRKSEMHPSQHRPPYSSSSSSQMHHHSSSSKPPYPGDALADHKSKPPSGYGSNAVNRPPPGHPSSSSSSQRGGMPPSSSSGRSSSSSASGSMSSQRPPSQQMHPMDYHKSRDRNGMNVVMPPGAHGVPPHKMPPKPQDPNSGMRSSSKDFMGRIPESSSKQSSSKMYPPSYGSQQMPPNAAMHGQRNSFLPPSSSNSMPPTSGSYHHQRSSTGSNNNNNSSSSSSSSSMSKSSVHGIPHASGDQLPPPPYSQSQQQHQSQQQQHATAHMSMAGSNSYSSSRDMPMQVDDHTSGGGTHGSTAMQQLIAQTQVRGPSASSAASSLFSPEWKDIKAPMQNFNSMTSNQSTLDGGMSMKRDRDSPKKGRLSPTKKDKNRMTPLSFNPLAANAGGQPGMRANEQQSMSGQQHLKSSGAVAPLPTPKKPEPNSAGLHDHSGSSQSGLKRINEIGGYVKHEEDPFQRDNKIRKMETNPGNHSLSLTTSSAGFGFGGSNSDGGSGANSITDKHPLPLTNGIETTPDLVRSLIKESLIQTNSLLKPDLTMPGLKPPAELLDPSATTLNNVPPNGSNISIGGLNNNSNTNGNESGGGGGGGGGGDAQTGDNAMADDKHDSSSSKTEKKKKKDKHKHKEKDKDKSKDREERKKHKKDKDKHKERERDTGDSNMEHVKIVIPKDKLEAAGAGELKIKIAKERFKTEGGTNHAVAPNGANPGIGIGGGGIGSGLKIKISKEALDNTNFNVGAYTAPSNELMSMQTSQQQKQQHQQQQQHHHQQQQQQQQQHHQQQHQQLQQQLQQHLPAMSMAPVGLTNSNAAAAAMMGLTSATFGIPGLNSMQQPIMSMAQIGSHGNSSNSSSNNNGSSNSSNKKKERDREREKDKKRNAYDFKMLSGGGAGAAMLPVAITSMNSTPMMHMQQLGMNTAAPSIATTLTSVSTATTAATAYAKK